ncbi:MAG: hypothetical protein ACFFDT_16060 [Candidatus Hodarchaeota archaeon]
MKMAHSFELKPEISEVDFLNASDKMQEEFYEQYDNLKCRELLKINENTLIEFQLWVDGPAPQDK